MESLKDLLATIVGAVVVVLASIYSIVFFGIEKLPSGFYSIGSLWKEHKRSDALFITLLISAGLFAAYYIFDQLLYFLIDLRFPYVTNENTILVFGFALSFVLTVAIAIPYKHMKDMKNENDR